MERENVPVVNPMGKDDHLACCPYCGWKNRFLVDGGKARKITRERDGFIQHIVHRKDNRKCEWCGKEFVIDFGEDTYTIYNPPKKENSYQRCLAKYESLWRYNFKIVFTNFGSDDQDETCYVENENIDYGYILTDPYANDFYKDPLNVIKLGEAYADHEVYPNFKG